MVLSGTLEKCLLLVREKGRVGKAKREKERSEKEEREEIKRKEEWKSEGRVREEGGGGGVPTCTVLSLGG